MKKYLMMAFVSLFAVAALSSCDKGKDEKNDDDGGGTNTVIVNNTITATVENGSSYNIETVKALVVTNWNDPDKNGSETGDHEVVGYEAATSPYTNGGFTLNLSPTVSSSYLYDLDDQFRDMPDITVSASSVKLGMTVIVACESGGQTGVFYHGTSDWRGRLMYASADVTITGYEDGHSGRISYDVHFKKGWNMIYEKKPNKGNNGYDGEMTTTAPAGAKWYYAPYDLPDEPSNSQGVIVNNTITATVENGSSYSEQIDVVKALAYTHREEDSETRRYEAATSPYTNGGFTLNLPSTVNSSYLNELEDEFRDTPDITVSASNVKTTWAEIFAYKSGRETGYFYHGTPNWMGLLMYVSADVTVTGYQTIETNEGYQRITYDLHLKRGWNIAYIEKSSEYDIESTTTAPAGAKWYYAPYDLPEEPLNPQGSVSKKLPALFGKSVLNK